MSAVSSNDRPERLLSADLLVWRLPPVLQNLQHLVKTVSDHELGHFEKRLLEVAQLVGVDGPQLVGVDGPQLQRMD